jgi:uracil-DNA glycosylase family 4
MPDPRSLAYLDAMGIDVYVRRGLAPMAAPGAVPEPERPPATPVARAVPSAAPVMPVAVVPGLEATLDWEPLREAVAACTRCDLHATRTQTVFGVGSHQARWMFIGEAPGADEDKQGEPFVGRAGQLLTSMIKASGLRREDVYIANVLKCRPPGNRDPKPLEAASCRGYLERQIELVSPTLIVAVGRIAAQSLLATDTPLARLRGRVHELGLRAWPLIVTYHPAYLLRSPGEKRKAWQDLLFARQTFARLARGERAAP